jgi:hypothetical protein
MSRETWLTALRGDSLGEALSLVARVALSKDQKTFDKTMKRVSTVVVDEFCDRLATHSDIVHLCAASVCAHRLCLTMVSPESDSDERVKALAMACAFLLMDSADIQERAEHRPRAIDPVAREAHVQRLLARYNRPTPAMLAMRDQVGEKLFALLDLLACSTLLGSRQDAETLLDAAAAEAKKGQLALLWRALRLVADAHGDEASRATLMACAALAEAGDATGAAKSRRSRALLGAAVVSIARGVAYQRRHGSVVVRDPTEKIDERLLVDKLKSYMKAMTKKSTKAAPMRLDVGDNASWRQCMYFVPRVDERTLALRAANRAASNKSYAEEAPHRTVCIGTSKNAGSCSSSSMEDEDEQEPAEPVFVTRDPSFARHLMRSDVRNRRCWEQTDSSPRAPGNRAACAGRTFSRSP